MLGLDGKVLGSFLRTASGSEFYSKVLGFLSAGKFCEFRTRSRSIPPLLLGDFELCKQLGTICSTEKWLCAFFSTPFTVLGQQNKKIILLKEETLSCSF